MFSANKPDCHLKNFNRLLIPELFALTLLGNRDVVRLLAYLDGCIQGGFGLPASTKGTDSWINQWIDPQLKQQRFNVTAARRSIWREEVLTFSRKKNFEIKEGFGRDVPTEHISVRAYPIGFSSPQKRNSTISKRLLLVAYHLERHWLYLQLEPLRYPWRQAALNEIDIAADLVSKKQWQDFVCQVSESAAAAGGGGAICLHVPDGSALLSVLQDEKHQVIDDMPEECSNGDRFDLEILRRESASLRGHCFTLDDAFERKSRS